MTSEVIKGHLKISKSSFSAIYFLFNAQSFKIFFKNVNILKTQIFHQRPSKIIKDHSFAKIFLAHVYGPILTKTCMNAKTTKTLLCYGEENFCDFLNNNYLDIRSNDNFCPCFTFNQTYWLVVPESRFSLQLVNTLFSIGTDHLLVLSKKNIDLINNKVMKQER